MLPGEPSDWIGKRVRNVRSGDVYEIHAIDYGTVLYRPVDIRTKGHQRPWSSFRRRFEPSEADAAGGEDAK